MIRSEADEHRRNHGLQHPMVVRTTPETSFDSDDVFSYGDSQIQ